MCDNILCSILVLYQVTCNISNIKHVGHHWILMYYTQLLKVWKIQYSIDYVKVYLTWSGMIDYPIF
jgi:hypothetical protein